MRKFWMALGGAALLAGSALAASPAIETAIKTRQANFKEMGKNFKALRDANGDAATIKAATAVISAKAAEQAKLFPKGSGPEAGLKTAAKAEIWTDWATFTKLQQDNIAAAAELNQVAMKGDMAALPAAAGKLGGTCKACHDKFKNKDN